LSWVSGDVPDDPNLTVNSFDLVYYSKATGDVTDDDPDFANPANGAVTVVGATNPYALPFAYETTYFFRVDSHVTWISSGTDVVEGPIWTFNTLPADAFPGVDIPVNNFVTWLDNLPETGLIATVDDSGEGDISLGDIDWTIVDAPEGTASVTDTSSDSLAPTASFTTDTAGVYTIQLTATDGLGQSDSDTVTINVTADACEAAQAVSGFSFNSFDSDQDCDVDTVDVAAFAAQWLDDVNLTAAVSTE
jgi:hypothetical protein